MIKWIIDIGAALFGAIKHKDDFDADTVEELNEEIDKKLQDVLELEKEFEEELTKNWKQ